MLLYLRGHTATVVVVFQHEVSDLSRAGGRFWGQLTFRLNLINMTIIRINLSKRHMITKINYSENSSLELIFLSFCVCRNFIFSFRELAVSRVVMEPVVQCINVHSSFNKTCQTTFSQKMQIKVTLMKNTSLVYLDLDRTAFSKSSHHHLL